MTVEIYDLKFMGTLIGETDPKECRALNHAVSIGNALGQLNNTYERWELITAKVYHGFDYEIKGPFRIA